VVGTRVAGRVAAPTLKVAFGVVLVAFATWFTLRQIPALVG
jgi:hypothetical protein